jgi:hypothetical protein
MTPTYQGAIDAVSELLSKLRLDFMFVGNVARAAWLSGTVDSGSIDVVAVMQPQQKNQIAMMASNRGFTVDRNEVERAEELDLVPLKFGDIRVHVLVATNALYATMVAAAPRVGEIKVASREDLALLFALSDDFDAVGRLADSPSFDRERYNARLTSIGLQRYVIPSGATDPLRNYEGDSSPSDAARNDKQ